MYAEGGVVGDDLVGELFDRGHRDLELGEVAADRLGRASQGLYLRGDRGVAQFNCLHSWVELGGCGKAGGLPATCRGGRGHEVWRPGAVVRPAGPFLSTDPPAGEHQLGEDHDAGHYCVARHNRL